MRGELKIILSLDWRRIMGLTIWSGWPEDEEQTREDKLKTLLEEYIVKRGTKNDPEKAKHGANQESLTLAHKLTGVLKPTNLKAAEQDVWYLLTEITEKNKIIRLVIGAIILFTGVILLALSM